MTRGPLLLGAWAHRGAIAGGVSRQLRRQLGFRNERSITLCDVAPRTGDRFTYTYDFGDDCEHVIVVEKLVPRATGTRYPRCADGGRACPPEDCGGVRGNHEMLCAARETGCEEHEDADRLARRARHGAVGISHDGRCVGDTPL